MERSKIIGVEKSVGGEPIVFAPPTERISGRRVLEWSAYCGTCGQGGPGFFGLRFMRTKIYPDEWAILRLWGATDWLTVNGRWFSAHPEQYDPTNKPLYSNFSDAKWDEFTALALSRTVEMFDVRERSLDFVLGKVRICLTEDPASRPVYAGTKLPRVLSEGDDLRTAWIIASKPWVYVRHA